MKKLCTLLALIMLLTCVPMSGCTTEPEPNPVSDFEYEISEDHRAVYILKYIGTSENVILPSEIDEIPVRALKGITGADGIEHEGVFEGTNVTSVIIPDSVNAVGKDAFYGCSKLTHVTFLGNASSIGSHAFENCTALQSIDLSTTKNESIGSSAFRNCSALEKIKFSNDLTVIGQFAFYDCTSLVELIFPQSLTTIEREAFINCTSLKEIHVPTMLDLFSMDSVRFHNNPALEKIVFAEGRTEITGYAFFDTTTNVEVTVPSSVEKFSSAPFFAHGSITFKFLGDCPISIENEEFYGTPTILYMPNTKGWDNCVWQDKYSLIPVQ